MRRATQGRDALAFCSVVCSEAGHVNMPWQTVSYCNYAAQIQPPTPSQYPPNILSQMGLDFTSIVCAQCASL